VHVRACRFELATIYRSQVSSPESCRWYRPPLPGIRQPVYSSPRRQSVRIRLCDPALSLSEPFDRSRCTHHPVRIPTPTQASRDSSPRSAARKNRGQSDKESVTTPSPIVHARAIGTGPEYPLPPFRYSHMILMPRSRTASASIYHSTCHPLLDFSAQKELLPCCWN
jgi:hypothetical protein